MTGEQVRMRAMRLTSNAPTTGNAGRGNARRNCATARCVPMTSPGAPLNTRPKTLCAPLKIKLLNSLVKLVTIISTPLKQDSQYRGRNEQSFKSQYS